jgi:hypothetical protein
LLQCESPECRNSVDEEFAKESKSHCNELLKMIIGIASGRTARSGADPFDFVRTHAAWRARHQLPLIAAYRTYWGITRDSLLPLAAEGTSMRSLTMLSDFWIEFFDLSVDRTPSCVKCTACGGG